jgi:hypothetical protein
VSYNSAATCKTQGLRLQASTGERYGFTCILHFCSVYLSCHAYHCLTLLHVPHAANERVSQSQRVHAASTRCHLRALKAMPLYLTRVTLGSPGGRMTRGA